MIVLPIVQVFMLMLVPLGQVQPNAQGHQRCGNRQNDSTRGSEVSQRQNEQQLFKLLAERLAESTGLRPEDVQATSPRTIAKTKVATEFPEWPKSIRCVR
jgi:hypothetical protein